MSLKALSSIVDRKIEKSVWASTQPCLTPFVTMNDSDTSPPKLTFAIIPVCIALIIVANFSGQPYFLSSCHILALPTVSNALLKSTNTMCSRRAWVMHFLCNCWRPNIISMVLRLPLKPHCVSGTTSGVTWVDSLLRRFLAKILPAMERREIPLFDYLSCK